MKQYWSFFKSGKFAFLALFFVSLTVISCDNDDDNNVSPDPPIEKGEIELAENAQALNYFDFINPNDVEILNADTTQIRVSQAYLDKIKTKVNKNDVLSIWRSIDTATFHSEGIKCIGKRKGCYSDDNPRYIGRPDRAWRLQAEHGIVC
jgi:hypothetical protein